MKICNISYIYIYIYIYKVKSDNCHTDFFFLEKTYNQVKTSSEQRFLNKFFKFLGF